MKNETNEKSDLSQYNKMMEDLKAFNKRAEREETERNRPPVICLGRDGKNHVFYSTATRDVYRLPAEKINWLNLLDMAAREHWERYLFPKETEAGAAPGQKELVAKAQETLLDDSRRKIFSPEAVRARGVWPDSAGGWLYNAGRACWYIPADGSRPEQVDNVRGRHVYETGEALPAPTDDRLTDTEGKQLVELLTARPWTMEGAGDLLAGWTVAALLAGCTPIRPHVWINAPAGTGKTYLKNDLAAILGGYALNMAGIPTEAAVRQMRKSDCLPLLLDEVEPGESKKNQKNIAALLELMRNAAYEGRICKGTQDGTGTFYLMKCNFALFSIADDISRDADASRIIGLRMERRSNAALSPLWERQKAGRDMVQSKDFHSRLISRLLALLPMICENQKNLAAALMASGADARKAEMFSVMMAGRHALTSHDLMTAEEIEKASHIMRAYDEQDEKESDFSRCLAVLLNHAVDIYGTGKRTVAAACELIATAPPDVREQAEAALHIVGLRWRDDKEALQVDPRPLTMQRIYTGTQWSNGKIKPVLAEGCHKKGEQNAAGIWIASARKTGAQTPQDFIFIPRNLVMLE